MVKAEEANKYRAIKEVASGGLYGERVKSEPVEALPSRVSDSVARDNVTADHQQGWKKFTGNGRKVHFSDVAFWGGVTGVVGLVVGEAVKFSHTPAGQQLIHQAQNFVGRLP